MEITIPRPLDSTPGVSLEAKKEQTVHSSRGIIRNVILPGMAAAAVLVGPHARDVVNNYHQDEAIRKVATLSQQEVPRSLRGAQSEAKGQLFGETDEAYSEMQKLLNNASLEVGNTQWQLPAGQFVSADQVKISEDGKTVELGGQNISFAQIQGVNGGYYIVAARPVHEDKLLEKDRTHMVNPTLIGGAKFDASISRGDLVDLAHENARKNLEASLKKYQGHELAEQQPAFNRDELIARK